MNKRLIASILSATIMFSSVLPAAAAENSIDEPLQQEASEFDTAAASVEETEENPVATEAEAAEPTATEDTEEATEASEEATEASETETATEETAAAESAIAADPSKAEESTSTESAGATEAEGSTTKSTELEEPAPGTTDAAGATTDAAGATTDAAAATTDAAAAITDAAGANGAAATNTTAANAANSSGTGANSATAPDQSTAASNTPAAAPAPGTPSAGTVTNDPAKSGAIGADASDAEAVTWALEGEDDSALTLRISGSGQMKDFAGGDENNAPWGDYADGITEIVVEEGLTNIGSNAFAYLVNVNSVDFPETSLTTIGQNAFSDCGSITSLSIPESVTYIGGGAFSGCAALETIDLPAGLKWLGSGTLFMGCRSLRELQMPEGAVNRNSNKLYSFTGCESLQSVAIPDDALHVDLSDCASLTQVQLPDTLQKLNLSGCTGLTEIVIPEQVSDLRLEDCTNLRTVELPRNIEVLPAGLFDGCVNLQSVTLGEGVTEIGDRAFNGCANLETVNLSDTLKVIGVSAFADCQKLKNVSFGGGLESIGESAFEGCAGLTAIRIPEGMTSLGSQAFQGCSGLTSVRLPYTLTEISDYCFYECTGLKTIVIPDGVTRIGDSAFDGCTGLTTVTVPANVSEIGGWAFANCSSMTRFNLYGRPADIWDDALNFGSSGLRYVFFYGSKAQWGGYGIDYLPASAKIYYITTPLTAVSLGTGTMELMEGSSSGLGLTFRPSNATCREYSVRIDDPSIVSYDKTTGLLKGLKQGTTNITVTTYDGGLTATRRVKVFADIANATVTGITAKTYTGEHQTQDDLEVRLLVNGVELRLVKGADYSLYYKNNINPGIATLVINSISSNGNCMGRIETSFRILCRTPELGQAQNTLTGVKITWSEVPEATSYAVWRKGSSSGSQWERIGITSACSYTDKAVGSGTEYIYTVRCIEEDNKTYCSSYDHEGLKIMYVETPQLDSLANANGYVRLNWKSVRGAYGYAIFRKEKEEDSWTRIGEVEVEDPLPADYRVTTLTYVDKEVLSGQNYIYTIRCLDENGAFNSACNAAGWDTTYVTSPELPLLQNAERGIKLTWAEAEGAGKYAVLRKGETDNVWTRIAVVSGTTYTDKAVQSGVKYTYTLRCMDETGTMYLSTYNTAGKTIRFLLAPRISSAANVSTGAHITWTKVPGAANYRVYRKTGTDTSAAWEILGATKDLSYTDKTAVSGTTYRYMVRCVDSTNTICTSHYYASGKITTFVARPSITSLTSPKIGQLKPLWTKDTNVTGYQVQRALDSAFVFSRSTVTITSCSKNYNIFTGLTRGKNWYTRVRAYKTVDGVKHYSAWSAVRVLKVR